MFKTPDNKFIQLKKLNFSEKKDLLSNVPNKQEISTLDDFRNPAYILPDGKVLHETTLDKHAHLFDSTEEYKNFIKGKNFNDSLVVYDETKAYASFNLKPSKITNFLKEAYTIDTTYADKEGYKTYVFENGSVCFIKNISPKTRRAFWFDSKASFEYYFWYVFGNEVEKP